MALIATKLARMTQIALGVSFREPYQLVHGTADHVLGHNDGTGNREDRAMRLLVLGGHSGGSW